MEGIVSISQVLTILWRRAWIVALVFLVAMIAAEGILLFSPARYDAEATASIDPGFVDPVTQRGGAGAVELLQGNMLQLVRSQQVGLDVVKRLNLVTNPIVQQQYQKSGYMGRESLQDWYASLLAASVRPSFIPGSNVLAIKFGLGDPNLAAQVANAFLAASVDTAVAMKASSADQTVQWFAPQIADLRREADEARAALEKFQAATNVATPTGTGTDKETTELVTVTQSLSAAKANLTLLQNQLSNDTTDLSVDPSDPDLQLLAGLKEKLSSGELWVELVKGSMGANNPKVLAEQSMIASLRKQIPEVAGKAKENVRTHLKQRITQMESLVASLEAEQAAGQKSLIEAQVRGNQLIEHYRDVNLRIEQLEGEERLASQAKLHSKLNFADIAQLDRAVPPLAPAFPNPQKVILIAVAAGLGVGLALAFLTEILDRRICVPSDLEFATGRPLLGVTLASNTSTSPYGTSPRFLRAS